LTKAKQYMLNNTRTLTPAAVNEFRFGVNELFNSASGELAYVRDVLSELKIPGVNPAPAAAWGAPSVTSITSISTWGGGGDPFEIRQCLVPGGGHVQSDPWKALLPLRWGVAARSLQHHRQPIPES
jgi:hypothetical protein